MPKKIVKTKKKAAPIRGLIVHTGYVESACVSPLILASACDFPTVRDALTHLAHYLLDVLILQDRKSYAKPKGHPEGCRCKHCDVEGIELEDFQDRLRMLGGVDVNSWPDHDGDDWVPWECSVRDVCKNAKHWAESLESLEHYLPSFLDPERITDEAFKKELIEYRGGAKSGGDASHFKRVGK